MPYMYSKDGTPLQSKEHYLAYQAAYEYDDRLRLLYNEQGRDYVIFIRTDGSDGMPPLKAVLGFGTEVPNPDKVRETLYNADGWKHGDRVLKEMDEREAVKKRQNQWLRDEIAGDAAERIEKVMRVDGNSPIIKSFSKEAK